ncbi:unnamed protein product [Prunus armeniaca]
MCLVDFVEPVGTFGSEIGGTQAQHAQQAGPSQGQAALDFMRAFTFYKLGGITQPNQPILVVANFSTTMETHLSSATASIPVATNFSSANTPHSAASSIPAAIIPSWLLQASQQP